MTNYLSIDIGGTYLKYAMLDQNGKIMKRDSVKTPDDLLAFKKVLDTIIVEHMNNIKAVTMSCPGKIDSQKGIVYLGGSLPFLHEFEICREVEEKFDIPCSVINDGKAAALAELWIGSLKGIQNGAAVTLGTGVGGGLILNGALYSGSHFQAGELSFMLLGGIKEIIPDIFGGYNGSAVRFIYEAATSLGLEDVQDGTAVFEAIKSGEASVVPLFEQYCRNIALILMNIQTLLDIEKAVIGGGISAQDILIVEIQRQYNQLEETLEAYKIIFDPLIIEACVFKNDAGIIGALYHHLLKEKKA